MMTARYLLLHPETDANWETHVRGLIAWVDDNFGVDDAVGATIVREQNAFYYPMGSHTSRFASVNALLAAATGDTAAKTTAYYSLNWATYMARPNGVVIDGPAGQQPVVHRRLRRLHPPLPDQHAGVPRVGAERPEPPDRRLPLGGGRHHRHAAGPALSAPVWVRLVRAGTRITAYASSDGRVWDSFGTAVLPLEATVQAGLVVTSHQNSVLAGAAFDGVEVTPAGDRNPPVISGVTALRDEPERRVDRLDHG